MSNMSSDGVPGEITQPVIALRDMGSFFFGGKVFTAADGDTFHGDHGYAQYFIPQAARNLPLIMWHGYGQSGKTWESTPDDRDGFWQIFTKRDWPVYIIDQPRRGRAGRGAVQEIDVPIMPDTESAIWRRFRLGRWEPPEPPEFFSRLSFSQEPYAIAQFLRQQLPNTGPEPFPDTEHRNYMADAVGDLIDRIGPCALMTHSHSGQYGWAAAMKRPALLKAIIALEVGEFAFPADSEPDEIPTKSEMLRTFMAPQFVAPDEFLKLTTIPILIAFGDNIATAVDDNVEVDLYRMMRERAKQFVATVNARGGDATFVDLPHVGIHGNTHFPMSDLNNHDVADLIEAFLARHGLDTREPASHGSGHPGFKGGTGTGTAHDAVAAEPCLTPPSR
jgi:pimeloyl-ACP methyl ester carboxylesterase